MSFAKPINAGPQHWVLNAALHHLERWLTTGPPPPAAPRLEVETGPPPAFALDSHGNALRLLQRIRDEAHRFAITFHRQSRKKRDLQSELDVVPGIGLRRRKTLLTAFGSLSGVRRATREELARVVGIKVADAVIAHFTANP